MESNNNYKQYETDDEVGSVSPVDTNNAPHKYSRLEHFLRHVAEYKLSKSTTEKFADCFKMVENAFYNCTKESPQNFMYFSYVLWKIAEVLGVTEVLEIAKREVDISLKPPSARMEHDILWNKICDELMWNNNKVQLPTVVPDNELPNDESVDYDLMDEELLNHFLSRFESPYSGMEHDILWNKIRDEFMRNDNKVQLTTVIPDNESLNLRGKYTHDQLCSPYYILYKRLQLLKEMYPQFEPPHTT